MKIIGIEIREGTYEGRAYKNVMFYGTEKIKNERSIGVSVRFEKVAFALLEEKNGIVEDDEVLGLMGKNLDFAYDKYDRVSYVVELPEAVA
jgi:hypothetical protein